MPGRRLLAFVAVLAAAVFVIGALLAQRTYGNERRDAEMLARQAAGDTASRVDLTLRDRIEFLQAVARLPAIVSGDRQAARVALSRLVGDERLLDDMGWIRPNGRTSVLARVPLEQVPQTDLSDREYFQAVIRTRRPQVSDALRGRGTPARPLVVIAVPTFDARQRLSGVLTGVLLLDVLDSPLRRQGDSRDLRLVDRAGQVISGRVDAGGPTRSANPELVEALRARRAGLVDDTVGLGGEDDQLLAFAPIPSAGWIAVYQQPRADAFSRARSERRIRLTLWGVLGLVSVGLAWLLGSRLDRSLAAERRARRRVDLLRRTGAALAAAITVQEVAEAAISDPELGARLGVITTGGRRPHVAATNPPGGRPSQADGLMADVEPQVRNALETGTPAFLQEPMLRRRPALPGTNALCAAAVLPLRTQARTIGVVTLGFSEPQGFRPGRREALLTLADQAAQALDRAQRYEWELAARRRAELLTTLTSDLERDLGLRRRAQRATDALVPVLGDAARIDRYLPSGGTEILGTSGPPNARTHVPVIEGDRVLRRPLRARGDLLALLTLSRWSGRPAFDADEIDFADELAARLGVLLENALLYEQQRDIAVELQISLLPRRLPEVPRCAVAVRYVPGAHHMQVGGDWYEVLPVPDGRVVLVVGDVVGHGLESAGVMGRLRTALVALAPRMSGPAELLLELDMFAAGVPGSELTTLTCAYLDWRDGSMVYACAGHPPPLVVDADGTTTWLDAGRSLPLRSVDEPFRDEATVSLPEGAKLLMYSDGLVERRGEDLRDGLGQLAGVAARHGVDPPEVFLDAILRDAERRGELRDDVVALCVAYAAPDPDLSEG